ncbi:N-acetylglucosamine-binding protein GbpA [Rugamonas rubra]|uniref:Chitin-binding protein n=1 Tax=Rugamonas rubra TaxID=758825 RepID=A0A1I4L3W1_9BURK|nr:N-acetylglucosamine-binding protein GbpA [Rugamonas rubra]SFL85529.1 chitin-binding protein [Rugamonas rubra]
MHHLTKIAACCALLASAGASAHGFIDLPESRNLLCKQGGNGNCGAIQWEPQSVEGPSGFPARGPADEVLASAGLAQFGELNEQTSSRWSKRQMQAGANVFRWQFTANHATRNWRYYITRADWNPNQKLGRAAFETTPFCVVDGGMRQPPKQVSHNCTVPPRSGYQVILGVWEIGDTPNSFYNMVDVMFKDGATPAPQWSQAGAIYPSLDLNIGDSVANRVFDAAGERPELQTKVLIASAADGQRNNWSYLLASRINVEQPLLRAGQIGQDGAIHPVYGQNTVYAKAGSNLTRVEVQVNKETAPSIADFSVADLQGVYVIKQGQLSITFSVTANGEMELAAYLYDGAGVAKGYASAALNNHSAPLALALNQPKAGPHQLVLKATLPGGAVLQKSFAVKLSEEAAAGAYDYTFPNSLLSYKAGSRVLQPKDGKVYVCKPFPYNGYCVQWSQYATHFEPGVGSNWRDAWTAQ